MFPGDGTVGRLSAHTKLAELHSPDRCPSFSFIDHAARGKDIIGIMEVKNEQGVRIGALVISARGDAETGKLSAHGVSIFSDSMIRHGHD